jgi:hypothetical protein
LPINNFLNYFVAGAASAAAGAGAAASAAGAAASAAGAAAAAAVSATGAAASTGAAGVSVAAGVVVSSVFVSSAHDAKKPNAKAKIEIFTKFFIFINFNCLTINLEMEKR